MEGYKLVEVVNRKTKEQCYIECEILPRVGELVVVTMADNQISGQVIDIEHLIIQQKIHQIKVYIE